MYIQGGCKIIIGFRKDIFISIEMYNTNRSYRTFINIQYYCSIKLYNIFLKPDDLFVTTLYNIRTLERCMQARDAPACIAWRSSQKYLSSRVAWTIFVSIYHFVVVYPENGVESLEGLWMVRKGLREGWIWARRIEEFMLYSNMQKIWVLRAEFSFSSFRKQLNYQYYKHC